MKVNKWNKIIFLISLLFVIQFNFANGQSGKYPKELEKAASSHGLTPLYDFSKIDPDMEGSTYVYGYAGGKKSDSAVFWAWKEVNGEEKYCLVFVDKTPYSGDCPKTIEYWNSPAGLSLYENKKLNLSHFKCLKDKKMKIPKGYKAEKSFVRVGNDESDFLFYLYKGSWWVLMRC